MEAKATVMSAEKIKELLFTYTADDLAPKADLDGTLFITLDEVLGHQAEISFKAGQDDVKKSVTYAKYKRARQDGKKAGRREVVEFINSNYFLRDTPPATTASSPVKYKYIQTALKWEAQTKEWEL